jgi:tetratricopeptide (TPR) repeat protein
MDVLSMTALLHQIVRMLSDPMDAVEHDLDLLAIGKLREDLGHLSEAVQLYQACLNRAQDAKIRCGVIERLSFIHKRNGEITKAMSLWHEAAGLGEIYAHVELAKIFEHQQKEFPEALEWTQTALNLIDSPSFPLLDRYQWKDALVHRKQRLEKKIKKQEILAKYQ